MHEATSSFRLIAFLSLIVLIYGTISSPGHAHENQVKSPLPVSADLSNFLARKKTVESIGQRIFRANANACPLLLPEFEAKTHRLDDYPRAFREAAKNEFEAEQNFKVYEVNVLHPNGLRKGDILLNDQNEASSEIDKNILNHRQGGFLKVQRDDQILFIAQNASKICPYPVTILPTSRIRAKAKGVEIFVSLGLIDFTQNDHELALIIAHELAHLTQGQSNSGIFGRNKNNALEFEADKIGLEYIIQAGFDPNLAIEFWRRWAGSDDIGSVKGKKRQRLERYLALKEYLETQYFEPVE